jgi:DNA-binding NarL/FixJ family response regulator
LFLSERTVEHHISRMLARFRLSTRTHLAAFALKHDLTGANSPADG